MKRERLERDEPCPPMIARFIRSTYHLPSFIRSTDLWALSVGGSLGKKGGKLNVEISRSSEGMVPQAQVAPAAFIRKGWPWTNHYLMVVVLMMRRRTYRAMEREWQRPTKHHGALKVPRWAQTPVGNNDHDFSCLICVVLLLIISQVGALFNYILFYYILHFFAIIINCCFCFFFIFFIWLFVCNQSASRNIVLLLFMVYFACIVYYVYFFSAGIFVARMLFQYLDTVPHRTSFFQQFDWMVLSVSNGE